MIKYKGREEAVIIFVIKKYCRFVDSAIKHMVIRIISKISYRRYHDSIIHPRGASVKHPWGVNGASKKYLHSVKTILYNDGKGAWTASFWGK